LLKLDACVKARVLVDLVSDDNIESVHEEFQRSPRKSVARASRELGMPEMTTWKVLRKRLCFNEEDGFVERLIFSDEVTFHISGNVRI
jgi:hypothetical protein